MRERERVRDQVRDLQSEIRRAVEAARRRWESEDQDLQSEERSATEMRERELLVLTLKLNEQKKDWAGRVSLVPGFLKNI